VFWQNRLYEFPQWRTHVAEAVTRHLIAGLLSTPQGSEKANVKDGQAISGAGHRRRCAGSSYREKHRS
jgi:hypothetical protein